MELSLSLLTEMGYALGIGLLVGLERSMGILSTGSARSASPALPRQAPEGSSDTSSDGQNAGEVLSAADRAESASDLDDTMGLRTFAVLSLLGFAAALVSERTPYVAPVALGTVGLLIIAMYVRAHHLGFGITSEVAALATCGLGMLCHGTPHLAGVLGIVLTAILSAKPLTHALAKKARRVELTDTLKFLVVVAILLPLMPNRALDPYGAFNPYKVTFLVVLISGIGYVGYFLTRMLGAQRGLGITGLIGGLTSSTAVTAAMAAQAKEEPSLRSACAFATVAANATMFIRVLVVVGLLDWELMLRLAWAIGTMGAVAAAAAALLWLNSNQKGAEEEGSSDRVKLKNPFSVGPALKFAGFFVVILLVARLAKQFLGDQGLTLAAAVSGLADVDAITLTIAEQTAAGTLLREVGAIGITIAVVSNSFVKSGIAWYSGGWGFGKLVGACLLAATGAGLAVVVLV